jgi:trimethylamine:corrinoid methyltransferase-like protein
MESGEVRGSTAADLKEMLKLVASVYTSGPPPVCPCDLDPRLQILWAEKTCLEMAPGFGGGIVTLDPDTIHWIGELHAVAGRHYDLALQAVISPLRLDRLALELFWHFKDDPVVRASINTSPIPVGGISAPMLPSGLLVQGVAEQLGGIIVSKRLGCAGPDTVLHQTEIDCGDMRYLTTAHSLPDTLMVALLQQDLVQYFSGYRPANMCLCTNAKLADGFAASDRMAYLLMLGLAGFRSFSFGAGQLSMDEIFSPAQFIIDQEIGRYVQHILDGAKWQTDAEGTLRCIAEGVEEGNFLSQAGTLDALPELFDSPILRRDNVNQWRAAGAVSVEQLALDRAKAAIASFVPASDAVPHGKLDPVFEQACRALGLDTAARSVPR